MSTWFSLYVHDAEPEVCSRDGRVWVQFLIPGPEQGSPQTVTLMLKNRAVAHTIGEALLVAAREPDTEGEPSEFPSETLANA